MRVGVLRAPVYSGAAPDRSERVLGHREMLFKRDFAGEMLDRFPDLHLVDCGFVYHRATDFPMDDITWFLLRKQ